MKNLFKAIRNREAEKIYLDDFIPTEEQMEEFTIRGKKHTSVIKGDMGRTAHTRAVL